MSGIPMIRLLTLLAVGLASGSIAARTAAAQTPTTTLAIADLEPLPAAADSLLWAHAEDGGETFSPTSRGYWSAAFVAPTCYVLLFDAPGVGNATFPLEDPLPPLPLGHVPGLCDVDGVRPGWYLLVPSRKAAPNDRLKP